MADTAFQPDEPLRNVGDSLFTEYTSLIQQLFESFDRLNHNRFVAPGTSASLMTQILELDAALQPFVDRLEHHHNVYQNLKQTRAELEQHNIAFLTLIKQIQKAEHTLEQVLTTARERVQVMRQANKTTLNTSEVIAYAQRIARYTSPLPGSNWAHPAGSPVPREIEMKKGLLYNLDRVPLETTVDEASAEAPIPAIDIDFAVHTHLPQTTAPPEVPHDELLDLDL
ncbi:hypothetical protein HDV00_001176 [Rhizophlyctis rosea]|nr:hypothetical protein HDV00_001176 [Rhizophlyctis rosea]